MAILNQKIGVIGLGIMGSAISANLLKTGFTVTGYDIRPESIQTLETRGGSGAASVRELAEVSDVVITSLPSVAALQEVVSGPDGLLAAAKTGLIVIEVSTFPIAAKQEAFDLLKETGTVMLDCPLSGTGAQAVTKDLLHEFIATLDIPDQEKQRLLALTPETYIGLAASLAENI